MMDCPPAKFGDLSNAHSGLSAAIAKFRLAAYMWQAHTAEEFRAAGLGRRSFRIEEEWSRDTLSRVYNADAVMASTAKVHLIRCDLTVAELRDVNIAQQNSNGNKRDKLHEIFSEALKAHGGVFASEAKPIVAGLILDSHYDAKKRLILAHAALGAHNPDGLSLGMFGSHLTYSWPRYLEEVPDCLLDTTSVGDRVGNDNGECNTAWEACCVGQGAFLHEVGHAFSAPHTTGIMARGYPRDWSKCFLSRTSDATCGTIAGVSPVTPSTTHECHWDIRDLLRFKKLPHFRQISDAPLDHQPPKFELDDDEEFLRIKISCEAGVAQIMLNRKSAGEASVRSPLKTAYFTLDELEAQYKTEEPLLLEVTAMNGESRTADLWNFFSSRSYIRVPGTSMRLQMKSVAIDGEGRGQSEDLWKWAVMLKKRCQDGSLVQASKIDVRVGCALDGAEVYYRDGTKIPCGPRGKHGEDPYMGGHQAKKIALPRGVDVVKVVVNKGYEGSYDLSGLRVWLSNGKAIGALNKANGGGGAETLATLSKSIPTSQGSYMYF
jgi:hypothetical protein